MLAQAERRARRHDVAITTVVGDLRAPPAGLPHSDCVIAPFRTFMHLAGDVERLQALRAAASLLAPGGRFVFDVFEPTAADIRATHDRWIARREGISERPLWDAGERRLALDVRLPGRVVSMTLEWRSAEEWRALCARAGLTVSSSQSGFDGTPLSGQQGDQVYVCTRSPDS
jgi:SAM-dependent methyltransferase